MTATAVPDVTSDLARAFSMPHLPNGVPVVALRHQRLAAWGSVPPTGYVFKLSRRHARGLAALKAPTKHPILNISSEREQTISCPRCGGGRQRERETETCVHRHVYENVYVYDCVCMYVKVCTVYAYELMGICICYRMRNVFVHIYTLHIPFIVHVNMIGS